MYDSIVGWDVRATCYLSPFSGEQHNVLWLQAPTRLILSRCLSSLLCVPGISTHGERCPWLPFKLDNAATNWGQASSRLFTTTLTSHPLTTATLQVRNWSERGQLAVKASSATEA
ncbi:unnamed protein product [Ectocarpus sp. CCAP 1310/34]|nr:unnamed protein product [Ectocarpus sp. CCAP 1310/34]